MTDRRRSRRRRPDRPRFVQGLADVGRRSLAALAEGWRVARPDDADPGLSAGRRRRGHARSDRRGRRLDVAARRGPGPDPAGRSRPRWLRSDDGLHAVVEMAEASGLSRLTPAERDPIGATSIGTGQLLRAAIDAGAHHVILGIGGSATTDGGRGLLDGPRDRRPGDGRGAGRGGGRGRVRRRQSAPRSARRGGRLRTAEGRDARRRHRPRLPQRRLGATSSRRGTAATSATRRAPARPVGSGSRCSPCRTASTPSPCAPASSCSMEAVDFDQRLRSRRPRHHRRRPDRLPDRVRQDRARRRPPGPGGRRPLHRRRRRRRAGRDRGAGGGRCDRRSGRGATAFGRGRDGGRGAIRSIRCGERIARLVSLA